MSANVESANILTHLQLLECCISHQHPLFIY